MSRRRTAADRRYSASPRGKYAAHKANASRRGVAFNLSFAQWWSIWEGSGQWTRRGNRRGLWCMARIGDVGGYEMGNVRIVRHETNTAERNRVVADAIRSGLGIISSVSSSEAPF